MLKRIVIICISFWLQTVNAEDFFMPYAGGQLIDMKKNIVEQHHIALSKNKKIDGRWLFENEVKVSGVLSKQLYEINTDDSYDEVANLYKRYFATKKQYMQFACEGRSCGSSNKWANDIFHESRLYGVDNKQFYWVLFDGKVYTATYLIERGNKRIYYYHETLESMSINNAINVFSGNACPDSSQLMAIKNSLLDKKGMYFLLYSVAGAKTAQLSQDNAQQCVDAIRNMIGSVVIKPLGLGEYIWRSSTRTFDNRVEIVKFLTSKIAP